MAFRLLYKIRECKALADHGERSADGCAKQVHHQELTGEEVGTDFVCFGIWGLLLSNTSERRGT